MTCLRVLSAASVFVGMTDSYDRWLAESDQGRHAATGYRCKECGSEPHEPEEERLGRFRF